MSEYVIYDPATGYVRAQGSGRIHLVEPTDFSSTAQALVYTGNRNGKVYVSNDEVMNCTEMSLNVSATRITADGIDETTISDIPNGTEAQWPDGQTDIVTDGEIRFSVDLAGTYTFRFTAVPYLDQEVVIEAVAAP